MKHFPIFQSKRKKKMPPEVEVHFKIKKILECMIFFFSRLMKEKKKKNL
jgi:hypothetical protein